MSATVTMILSLLEAADRLVADIRAHRPIQPVCVVVDGRRRAFTSPVVALALVGKLLARLAQETDSLGFTDAGEVARSLARAFCPSPPLAGVGILRAGLATVLGKIAVAAAESQLAPTWPHRVTVPQCDPPTGRK
jgi:hypothetical protein